MYLFVGVLRYIYLVIIICCYSKKCVQVDGVNPYLLWMKVAHKWILMIILHNPYYYLYHLQQGSSNKTNGQCIVKFNPSTFVKLINVYNITGHTNWKCWCSFSNWLMKKINILNLIIMIIATIAIIILIMMMKVTMKMMKIKKCTLYTSFVNMFR
jgi:hypothetical protein